MGWFFEHGVFGLGVLLGIVLFAAALVGGAVQGVMALWDAFAKGWRSEAE